MSQLSAHLGATAVRGWVRALLLAMDKPENLEPSLVVLDGFNSLGEDNANGNFIKTLYGLMNAEKKHDCCSQHAGGDCCQQALQSEWRTKNRPIPGSYTGGVTSPKWNGMKWSRDLLIAAVRYKLPDNFPMDHKFDFIVDDMTPLEAKRAALLSSRRAGKGGPPGSQKEEEGNPK